MTRTLHLVKAIACTVKALALATLLVIVVTLDTAWKVTQYCARVATGLVALGMIRLAYRF